MAAMAIIPMMPENQALQNMVSQNRVSQNRGSQNRGSQNNAPQRVVSLQPSITVTLRDLGLLSRLVACTKYCVDVCPEVLTAGCIIIEDSWSAKAEQIIAAQPDLVIASVPYRLESVAEIIKSGAPFLGLAPKCLADVYQDILMIARIVSAEDSSAAEVRGLALVDHMQKEIAEVQSKLAEKNSSAEKPLVYCEEWGKPLILSQTW